MKERAIPLFQEWGYETEIVHSDKDYLDIFYHTRFKSSKPERNGKYAGWLIGGRCEANRDLKIKPIKEFFKRYSGQEYTEYVGIAIDEPERLERLKGTNKISLLERYSFTEQQAYDLCKEYDLLSPIYSFSKRGGVGFAPAKQSKSLRTPKSITRSYGRSCRGLQKSQI